MMQNICRPAIEAAGMGAPAASVMCVAIIAVTALALVVYLNWPVRRQQLQQIEHYDEQ